MKKNCWKPCIGIDLGNSTSRAYGPLSSFYKNVPPEIRSHICPILNNKKSPDTATRVLYTPNGVRTGAATNTFLAHSDLKYQFYSAQTKNHKDFSMSSTFFFFVM